MYALTIQEPWLSCILYHGKDVENRCYPLAKGMRGEAIALHTGKKIDDFFYCLDTQKLYGISKDSPLGQGHHLPLGQIVAIARFTDCTYQADIQKENKWAMQGQYQWHVAVDQILEAPIPARGSPKFWEVLPEVEAAIQAQIREAAPCA